jgi:hypothetical protein
MCFFNFIKQQSADRRSVVGHSQRAALAEFRAQEQPKRFLCLVFGHIEARQLFFSEKEFSEREGNFRFPDARGAKK